MGFGTCCLFTIESRQGTATENSTYIRNEDFPSALMGTATNTLAAATYTLNKCSEDVCHLRLDFVSFNIQAGTAFTGGAAAGTMDSTQACQDTFQVTANNNGNGRTPVICGQNTGEHMYIDVGSDTSATIGFTFAAGIVANRNYEIKVTQFTCNSPMAPPSGCLQYHTGTMGTLMTFNFAGNTVHLQNQDYNICIRQEEGYCCNQYTVCTPVANQGGPFSLSLIDAAGAAATAVGAKGQICSEDYITIAGSSEICNAAVTQNLYCGDVLSTNTVAPAVNNPICDCTAPFQVGIFTDAAMLAGVANEDADAGFLQSRGVCLDYTQIPCPA